MFRIQALTIVAALAAGSVLAAVDAARAQMPPQPPPPRVNMNSGDEKERAACHPDVTKFCQTQLEVNPNDVLGILTCLQANRSKISHACQQVLAKHGQ